ncbi:site-specific integrase [Oxalobacteraceae sp. CFBP 13708]|nr:site-specific integrase [Oxalobacteraceae sp. CFBP 13708]
MATIENRSRYIVSVKNRSDLYREFPFTQLKQAKQYAIDLGKKFKVDLSQKENAFLVKIIKTGHAPVRYTCRSLQEAEDAIARIEAERRTGLFLDYTRAHTVTFEDLLRTYVKEEGPRNKGWEKSEKYKCLGWLADLDGASGGTPARPTPLNANEPPRKGRSMRKPATAIQWMRKSFADILTTDIEDYIKARGKQVKPSTIDRELDVMRSIFSVATKVWKYRLGENPMDGVRRPKYWNERDRRFREDEEARLIKSAIEEDRLRSIDLRVEQLMAEHRVVAATFPTIYAKKKFIKGALALATIQARADAEHIPMYETFIQFQIMTAARRSEALGLTWQDIDFEYRSAYLAETKNGQSRKLPLREVLLKMLESLPRTGKRVFTITDDLLSNAWSRICARAGLEDLHVHDLRHEGISRVAETSKFSLIDLQAFSGHRDVRMLLRYAHLCTTQLAAKLDEVFAEAGEGMLSHHYRGRKRIRSGNGLTVAAIVADSRISVETASASSSKPTAQVIPLFGIR